MTFGKRTSPSSSFRRHFRKHGLPVPEIYAEDARTGAYLEEDLGNTTLFEFVSENRTGDEIEPVAIEAYRRVVDVLPRFQIEAGRDLNYKVCYPRGSFDRQSIAWDLNYFKYYFLRLAGIPFSEQALENDFARLTKFLLSADHDYFLYRDFQSRNVMLRDGKPFLSITRVAAKARLQYDIASLLFDAKADLPPAGAAGTAGSLSRIASRSTSSWIARRSLSITTRTCMCASCRRLGPTDFAGSTSAKRISCRACRMR